MQQVAAGIFQAARWRRRGLLAGLCGGGGAGRQTQQREDVLGSPYIELHSLCHIRRPSAHLPQRTCWGKLSLDGRRVTLRCAVGEPGAPPPPPSASSSCTISLALGRWDGSVDVQRRIKSTTSCSSGRCETARAQTEAAAVGDTTSAGHHQPASTRMNRPDPTRPGGTPLALWGLSSSRETGSPPSQSPTARCPSWQEGRTGKEEKGGGVTARPEASGTRAAASLSPSHCTPLQPRPALPCPALPCPAPPPPVDVCSHGALLPRQHLWGRPGPGAQRARLAQVALGGLHAASEAHICNLAGAVARQQDCAQQGCECVCVCEGGGSAQVLDMEGAQAQQEQAQAHTHTDTCACPTLNGRSHPRHPLRCPAPHSLTIAALDVQVHDAMRVLHGEQGNGRR